MKEQFQHIISILILVLGIFTYCGNNAAFAACSASGSTPAIDATKANTSGVFSEDALKNMQNLMTNVYDILAQVSMFGHSLVCYAMTRDLGGKLIGVTIAEVRIFAFTLYDFSMLLCGIFVFVIGILMAYGIGMYFVDVSLKIGFAVLFLPITIALWPFKPTSQKFMDNLFIILRNSMLFALVAITVSMAVALLREGLQIEEYWTLVNEGVSKADQVKKLYNLSTSRFLTIAFVLVFSFKLLSASVEKFLDFFFNDPAFGSESPMHHMGTQAVGMAWQLTGKQALSYAGDVAMNITGKAMIGVGNSLNRMSQGDFSDIKRIGRAAKSAGSAAIHPVRTTRRAFNATRRAAGSVANSALRGAGSVAKELHDVKGLLKVGDFYEQEYREKQQAFDQKVDNFTQKGVKNAVKQAAAAGIATGLNTANVLGATARAPFQSGSITDRAANTVNAFLGENSSKHTTAGVRSSLDSIDNAIAGAAAAAGAKIKQKAPEIKQYAKEKAKAATSAGVAAASQAAAAVGIIDQSSAMDSEEARAALHSGKENAKAFMQNVKTAGQVATEGVKAAAAYVDQHTQGLQEGTKAMAQRAKSGFDPDKTNISLSPSALISAPFKIAGGIGNTIKMLAKIERAVAKIEDQDPVAELNMKKQAAQQIWQQSDLKKAANAVGQFAKETSQDYKSIDGGFVRKATLGTGKVVIKKSGQIFVRTTKETAQDTVGTLGKVFVGFGKSLTNRGRGKSGWQEWKEKEEERKRAEYEQQEERLQNQSLADKYDN